MNTDTLMRVDQTKIYPPTCGYTLQYAHTYTHLYIYKYIPVVKTIHIYVCMFMYVCMYVCIQGERELKKAVCFKKMSTLLRITSIILYFVDFFIKYILSIHSD